MIQLTKTAKIATGATRPNEWQQYSPGGIRVDVDTSAARFTKTPTYITAIHGSSHHWATVGASSVYNASPTGFTIYVRWADGGNLLIADAQRDGWHIQWIGIED